MCKICINLFIWVLCVGAAILALTWQFFSAIVNNNKHIRIAYGFDQTLNAALGGHEDEMISSKTYRMARQGRTWAVWLEKFLNKIDPEHTQNSYKTDHIERKLND